MKVGEKLRSWRDEVGGVGLNILLTKTIDR